MEALLKETAERSGEYGAYQVSSVFIGGGTPSIVATEWLERLMEAVRERYRLSEHAEITMEMNPGTADAEKLRRCRLAGINRLSIGLQSADDAVLKRLGRIHTFAQFLEAYAECRNAGFANVNVDLMSGLPGQSAMDYRITLEKVLSLSPPPEHISAYSLIVEEGTPFAREAGEGLLELPDEETERQMYGDTARLLGRGGYRRYEISNYALEGFACRHNLGYWRRREYAGFGIGAASLVGNVRFSNGAEMAAYLRDPLGCREEIHTLSQKEQMEETFFLGLRMTEGVDRKAFRELFGRWPEEIYGSVLDRNEADGLLVRDENRIWLTERGLDVSNYVMAQFLLDD